MTSSISTPALCSRHQMKDALSAAWEIATVLPGLRKPLDILVTATRTGFDIDIKGHGPLAEKEFAALGGCRGVRRCAAFQPRVSHYRAAPPIIRLGLAELVLPPGAFLQATEAGEIALGGGVTSAFVSVRRGLDLFAGVGTFSLRLADPISMHAVDSDEAALAALTRACREQPKLRPCFDRMPRSLPPPFDGRGASPYDGVVFDPPRAGAEAQAQALWPNPQFRSSSPSPAIRRPSGAISLLSARAAMRSKASPLSTSSALPLTSR